MIAVAVADDNSPNSWASALVRYRLQTHAEDRNCNCCALRRLFAAAVAVGTAAVVADTAVVDIAVAVADFAQAEQCSILDRLKLALSAVYAKAQLHSSAY